MGNEDLKVRRARASDAEQLAVFFSRALLGRTDIDRRAVTARLGDVSFLLAEDHVGLRGVLGWRVENLVACVIDLLIWPPRDCQQVGQVLFAEMERAASDLQAEAAVLFVPQKRAPELSVFFDSLGYAAHGVNELPIAWREMAYRAGRDEADPIPLKQLRPDRVLRPL